MERILSKKRLTKQILDCVGSSNVVRARYDLLTGELEVDFLGGVTYVYTGVTMAHWKGLREAPSKGGYLATQIKPNYPAKKLERA